MKGLMVGWRANYKDGWIINVDNNVWSHSSPPSPQNKYKEEGRKEMSSSLYSLLPETSEMQLAKAVHEFQSEVRFFGQLPLWSRHGCRVRPALWLAGPGREASRHE